MPPLTSQAYYIQRRAIHQERQTAYLRHLAKYGLQTLTPRHHLVKELILAERMMLVAARDWADERIT